MRIREKVPSSSCIKMTNEMNGDPTRKLLNSNDSDLTARSDLPFTNDGNDINNLSHLAVNKGLKGRVRKPIENDGAHSPGSPISEDLASSGGGRLKFFKDGKFILELSHRKEGEKTCWIPVKRKTYWPAVGVPRNEGSATLSVSDDSSSVQSSPWQRDHCWKQNNPKPNLNRDLEFYFFYGGRRPCSREVKLKCRKPFDLAIPHVLDHCFKENSMKRKRKVSPKNNSSPAKKDVNSFNLLIKFLWERALNPGRTESIVSPRKRILREMERVSLEEASKRQRAKTTLRSVGSHSISSILAKDDDMLRNSVLRNLLRSPSPDHIHPMFTPAHAHQNNDYYPEFWPPAGSTYPPVLQYPVLSRHECPYNIPNTSNNMWQYSPSSPPQFPPFGPSHSMVRGWPRNSRPPSRRDSSDVPLNLSKNAHEC